MAPPAFQLAYRQLETPAVVFGQCLGAPSVDSWQALLHALHAARISPVHHSYCAILGWQRYAVMRIPQTVAAPVLLCSPPAAASGFPLEASCTGSVAVLFRTSAIGMDDDKEGGYDPTASHKGFQAHPVKVPRNVSVRVHPPKASVPT